MFEVESVALLSEDEILKLYELFFGPVLIRKPVENYVASIKTLLDDKTVINKLLEKLNSNELKVFKLLSLTPKTPVEFINEKVSILIGEHPSIVGKIITNLQNKNYIFIRDDKYIIVPLIFSDESFKSGFDLTVNNKHQNVYENKSSYAVNNILLYLLTKEIKFSKSGTLYKKDFEELKTVFTPGTDFTKDEFDIISYFCFLSFLTNDVVNWHSVKHFFAMPPIERILQLVRTVFPYLQFFMDEVYSKKSNSIIKTDDFTALYKHNLLISELNEEPFKADIDTIITFFQKLGIFKVEGNNISILYYNSSAVVEMDIKLSSNFSIYINSSSTDENFFKSAVFANFVKFDKVSELEINDLSIKRAINSSFNYSNFTDFVKHQNMELTPNVEKTIRDWFEKYSSYYLIEGTVFFCETEEKGKMINQLIEKEFIFAHEMKENSIFLIPEEEKERFFDFLNKSKLTFYNKKPKLLKHNESVDINFPADIKKLLNFH